MASTYEPTSVGVQAPSGGFQQGGWYSGRQYWGGSLSDPGAIHPQSNQQGAGQLVSAEVNAQSAAAQGVTSQNLEAYLEQQRQQATSVQPSAQYTPGPQQQASRPTGETGTTGTTGITQQETPKLMETYKKGMESPKLKGWEDELEMMDKEYIENKGKTNDNPFLSEATRVGRIAKIEQLYGERTADVRGRIATAKADVETELNIMTQQWNIDSQASQQALSQLDMMLSKGMLDNASGEDIANVTRGTGVSSNMIYSAIEANKKKNVQTSTISFDDGTNQGFAVINSQTGEIINKQVVAASKPTAGGKVTESEKKIELQSTMVNALENAKNSYGHISPQDWQGALASWIARGGNAEDFEKNFRQYADPNRKDFKQAYGIEKL